MNVKPRLRIVSDQFNNVGRMCTISGTNAGRVWRITTPMINATSPGLERWYACVNLRGERVIAPVTRIGNMY